MAGLEAAFSGGRVLVEFGRQLGEHHVNVAGGLTRPGEIGVRRLAQ
jgi:hypothetical protein